MNPYLQLGLAVVCVSFGSILVRWAEAPPLTVAFYRMFFACAGLAPFALPSAARALPSLGPRLRLAVVGSGLALGVHFATWIASLSYTSVAASVLLVNMAPLFTLALSWLVLRETPRPAVFVAAGMALLGAGLIAAGDWSAGPAPLTGDLLALAGAAALSVYHVIGRGLRAALPLRAYVFGVWSVAAIALAALAVVARAPLVGYSPRTLAALLALALVPTLGGHGLVNRALRALPAPVVGLFLLGEPVGASLLAFALLGEVPGPWTAAGGLMVLGSMAFLVLGRVT